MRAAQVTIGNSTTGDAETTTFGYDPNTSTLNSIVRDPSGLALTYSYTVDNLGRYTQITEPDYSGSMNPISTYIVYRDDIHEVRTYPGWNPQTGTTLGPTQITREDPRQTPRRSGVA